MNDERRQHMRKATRLLRSVELRAKSDDPDAVASTAYYAMFHAACAVLLLNEKRLPKTHSSLIGQFGLATKDAGAAGREAGALLHEAYDRRATGRLCRFNTVVARRCPCRRQCGKVVYRLLREAPAAQQDPEALKV